jgi:hypothetical protein
MPPDPLAGIAELAAHTAELFKAFTEAGIPAHPAAVMIGTWMGTTGASSQEGGDG